MYPFLFKRNYPYFCYLKRIPLLISTLIKKKGKVMSTWKNKYPFTNKKDTFFLETLTRKRNSET
jgi:hypothetical protein